MIRSTLSSWREYLTPVTHVSTFRKTGEITPEEFIQAGDYLVYKFPTWSWGSGSKSKRRDFLPPDKQFLVTKHVPSYIRASSFEEGEGNDGNFADEVEDEEGWTTTGGSLNPIKQTTSSNSVNKDNDKDDSGISLDNEDDFDEIDDFEEDDDDVALPGILDSQNKTTNTRTYNLYITYSTSYRVPKMYLSGFNSDGNPLSPDDMFEDIVGEYKHKTVTIEKSPFIDDLTMVSIHPCRHANVMRVLISRTESSRREKESKLKKEKGKSLVDGMAKLGLANSSNSIKDDDDNEWEDISGVTAQDAKDQKDVVRVDQYLVIFLKFISSVTPGIEHDYTMDAF